MERHSTPHIDNPAVIRALVNSDRGYGAATDIVSLSEGAVRGVVATKMANALAADGSLRNALKWTGVAIGGGAAAKVGDTAVSNVLDRFGKKRKRNESIARDALRAALDEAARGTLIKLVKGIPHSTRTNKPLQGMALRFWNQHAARVGNTARPDVFSRVAQGARGSKEFAQAVFGTGSHASDLINAGFNSRHRALYAGVGIGAAAGAYGMHSRFTRDPEAHRDWAIARINTRYGKRTDAKRR